MPSELCQERDEIVSAVREGDDARVEVLLERFAASVDARAVFLLRLHQDLREQPPCREGQGEVRCPYPGRPRGRPGLGPRHQRGCGLVEGDLLVQEGGDDVRPSLHTFISGLERDLAAVIVGLTLPWSSGVLPNSLVVGVVAVRRAEEEVPAVVIGIDRVSVGSTATAGAPKALGSRTTGAVRTMRTAEAMFREIRTAADPCLWLFPAEAPACLCGAASGAGCSPGLLIWAPGLLSTCFACLHLGSSTARRHARADRTGGHGYARARTYLRGRRRPAVPHDALRRVPVHSRVRRPVEGGPRAIIRRSGT